MKSLVRVACAAFALLIAQPALADSDLDPASATALKSYTLSMDKVKAMQASMDESKKNAALMKSLKSVGDSHRCRRGGRGSSFCWHGLFFLGECHGFKRPPSGNPEDSDPEARLHCNIQDWQPDTSGFFDGLKLPPKLSIQ